MKSIVSFIILLLIGSILIIIAYLYSKPINFLFVTCLLLIIIYSIATRRLTRDREELTHFAPMSTRLISLLCLMVIFATSLKVLKDYQNPAGEASYFTNTDHHAIRNTGIAFNQELELFAPVADSSQGIWSDPYGSLHIQATEGGFDTNNDQKFFDPGF